MKASKVQEAAAEARRFLNRVDQLNYLGEINYEYDFIAPGKDSAAIRRASMDLTRALAAMRQS